MGGQILFIELFLSVLAWNTPNVNKIILLNLQLYLAGNTTYNWLNINTHVFRWENTVYTHVICYDKNVCMPLPRKNKPIPKPVNENQCIKMQL